MGSFAKSARQSPQWAVVPMEEEEEEEEEEKEEEEKNKKNMGPESYMRSVVDQNVVMRRIPVL